jgi:sugar phosphate isomerase/epimerase
MPDSLHDHSLFCLEREKSMAGSCFCTIAFQNDKWGGDRTVETPIDEIWPILADAGYDAIELWWPHVEHLSEHGLIDLGRRLAEAGLAVAMVSPYFDFTSGEGQARQSVQLGRRVLSAARLLGSRGVRVFTGKVGSAEASEEQWDLAVSGIRQLADDARDLTWALETHPRNLMDTVPATRKLLERIDRRNVGLIFQPSTFAPDELAAADALGASARHVHATNSNEEGKCLLAEGAIDYPAVLGRLEALGFSGYVSVEWMGDDPADIARREAEYLRRLLA